MKGKKVNEAKEKIMPRSGQGGAFVRMLLVIMLVVTMMPISPVYAEESQKSPETSVEEVQEKENSQVDSTEGKPSDDGGLEGEAPEANNGEADDLAADEQDKPEPTVPEEQDSENSKEEELKENAEETDQDVAILEEDASLGGGSEAKDFKNSISGIVWYDENDNGMRDEGEAGISGYPVSLYQNGNVVDSSTTADDGSYIFSNMKPGEYEVGVQASEAGGTEYLIPMKAMQAGSDNKFDVNWESDPIASFSSSITVSADSTVSKIDAGVRTAPQVVPMANVVYFRLVYYGKVADQLTGQPVPGAKVTFQMYFSDSPTVYTNKVVTADANGCFTLDFTSPPRYHVGAYWTSNSPSVAKGSPMTVCVPSLGVTNVPGLKGYSRIPTYLSSGGSGTVWSARLTTSFSVIAGGTGYSGAPKDTFSGTSLLTIGSPTAREIVRVNRIQTINEYYYGSDGTANLIPKTTSSVNYNEPYSKSPAATISGTDGKQYRYVGYRIGSPTAGNILTGDPVTIANVLSNQNVYFFYEPDETTVKIKHVMDDGLSTAVMPSEDVAGDTFRTSTSSGYNASKHTRTDIAPTRVEVIRPDSTTDTVTAAAGSPITKYSIPTPKAGTYDITFYYDKDTDNDGVPDYDIVEKYTLADQTTEKAPAESHLKVPYGDNLTLSGKKNVANYTYIGYIIDNNPMVNAPALPSDLTNVKADSTIYYIYQENNKYNVTVKVVDRQNNPLTIAGYPVIDPVYVNNSYTATVPAAPSGNVYVGWYQGAPGAQSATIGNAGTPPTIASVTAASEITLVYGRDIGGGGNLIPGGDGAEDFDVVRTWKMSDGTAISGMSPATVTEVWNTTQTFTKAHTVDRPAALPAGLTYVGFRYDSDVPGTVRPASDPISIDMSTPLSDKGITYLYETNKYTFKATYRYDDNNGGSTALPGVQTMQVLHGSNLTVPAIKVPTASDNIAFDQKTLIGWAYASSPSTVTAGAPNLTHITGNTEIVLVYGQDMDRNGKRDYTVTESHKAAGSNIVASVDHYVDYDGTLNLSKSTAVEGMGYTYVGYSQNNGLQNSATSMSISAPTQNHQVVFDYSLKAYTVLVEHVYRDNAGVENTFNSYSVTVDHGSNTPALTVPKYTDDNTLYAAYKDMTPRYWKADNGSDQVLGTPSITGVTGSGRSIQIVYVQDMNNNNIQDYTITEKRQTHLSFGDIDPVAYVYVDEGDTYSGTPTISTSYHTYVGHHWDGNTANASNPAQPVVKINITADHEIVFLFSPDDYAITVKYEYRHNDGTITYIAADQVEQITHGLTFNKTVPVGKSLVWLNDPANLPTKDVPNVIYQGWELDGAPQSGDPEISPVVKAQTITLIYVQDADNDGVRDYNITEKHVTGVALDDKTYTRVVNENGSYNGALESSLSPRYTYQGYDIDGSTSALAPDLPSIVSVTAEHTVTMNYGITKYPVDIEYKYIASNGAISPLPLPGLINATTLVNHGATFAALTPEFTLGTTTNPAYQYKTFGHWTLDGGPNNTGTVSVVNVTAPHKVVVYYVQDMNENRTRDWTVIEQHLAGSTHLASSPYTKYIDDGAAHSVPALTLPQYTYTDYSYDAGAQTGIAPGVPTIPAVNKNYEITLNYQGTTFPVSVTYAYRDNAGNPDVAIGASMNKTDAIAYGGNYTAYIPTKVNDPDFDHKAYVGYTVDGGSLQTGAPVLSGVTVAGSGGTYDIVLIYRQDADGDGNPDVTVTKNHLENKAPYNAMAGSVAETTYVNFPSGSTTATFADAPKSFGSNWAFDHFDINSGVPKPQYALPNETVSLGDANFTVNYYYEKLAPPAPVIKNVVQTDTAVSGTGHEAGSTILITWPDTTTDTVTVQADKTWTVNVPGGLTLSPGDVITAVETNDWPKTGPAGSATVGLVTHNVKVTYQYKDGTVLPGTVNDSVAHGTNYTVVDPGFTEKVLRGWMLDGVRKSGTAPALTNVTGDHEIVLLYGQDKGGDPNNPGPDGIEDYTVYEKCVCEVYKNVLDGPREVYVNKGDTYVGAVKSYTGRYYDGYTVNGGNVVAAPSAPTVANIQADQQVEMLHNFNSYTIEVKHVDEDGKAIAAGKDYTQTALHGESWTGNVTALEGYDFSYWQLDGAKQSDGTVEINKVTDNVVVTLVYKKQEEPEPEPDNKDYGNYNFIKKPNVKNVAAGETVNYTFSGFGNQWPFEIERFAILDKPDRGLDFKKASLPAFANGKDVSYDVLYQTNYSGSRVLHADVSAASSFYFEAPSLASGEYITGIVLDFGTVPSGFAVGDTMNMTFKVWDNPPATSLTNLGVLTYKVGDEYKEFTTGSSGMITIGGWFSLPQTGDAIPLATIAVLAVCSLSTLLVSRRERKVRTRKH